MRAASLAFVALTIAGPLIRAHADEAPPPTLQAAQRHFESGVNFYKSGDYEAARIEFEAGHRLSKLPDFLVNLCQVADKQNRVQDAINYCEQYLLAEPNAKDGTEVHTRLDGLRQRQADPTKQPATAPLQLNTAPADNPPVASAARPSERAPVPKPALALLIGGGVLVLAGAGAGASALATARELEAGPVFRDVDGLTRRGEALNGVAITFWVVGGVAAVAGAGWTVRWASSGRHSASRHGSVALAPPLMLP